MANFFRSRSTSPSIVVLILLVIVFLQGSVSTVTLTGIASSRGQSSGGEQLYGL